MTFEEGFAEVRYRFGEEGAHLVDPALSLEYSIKLDPEDGRRHRLLEPRIVLNRDVQEWNFTVNLFYAIVLDDSARSALEASAGFRTPSFGSWNAGLEIRQERPVEKATVLIPQTWYRFTRDAYLKLGAGKNLVGDRDTFVRVAFEIEF